VVLKMEFQSSKGEMNMKTPVRVVVMIKRIK